MSSNDRLSRRRVANAPLTMMAAALLLVTTVGARAEAQTARTFEELQTTGRVTAGTEVTVDDEAGRRVRGVVRSLSDEGLTVRVEADGKTVDRVFTEGEVVRIRRGGSDVMALSALTGAGVAFAFTALGAARYGGNEGGGACGACLVQWSTMTVPIGAVIGAAIGFSIDRASVRTVFARSGTARTSVSIVPLVGANTVGGFATIRF
jgi:hypothetical protein